MKILKLLSIFLLFASLSTKAALVSTIHTDTSNALDISWQWDGLSPSKSEPIFSNWYTEVELTVDLSTSSSGFIGDLRIVDSTDPFSLLAPLIILGDSTTYGTLADLDFIYLGVNYQFVFERDVIPQNSTIQLTAAVVPIPGALIFFVSAIFPLLVKSRYRRSKNV